ncbi:glycosyl hydrolase [uncultured Kriegella sp.]|uniref:VPS10 domain-containing protein n=1 Tax=uncultured Kriegella sp. TaxID=1798910 RepID=UPI0030D85086|tara:strand:- start:254620 stop:257490 length:2871 start_codon:yes stop_codon:yes gene_type:complete
MKIACLVILLGIGLLGISQPVPTMETEVMNALQQKRQLAARSLVKNIPLKNIGPSVMSGRVVDVDVNPDNTIEFYVGYASGGLWYTNNNGTSFTPVLDDSDTQNIGDIAVDWKSGSIWVGTGENNASRSSYAGIGILKSIDHGKTWVHMGLPDSQHIGRIVINPENADEVVIGVTGHLYSQNENRGIYKTTNGGQTWTKTLFINDSTGIIDVATNPKNFKIMYAAAWEKDRKAWDFKGNGAASAIYKSTDGGNSWKILSTEDSGLPTGEGVGRIGLAVFDEHTIYALYDNQFRRPEKADNTKKTDVLTKEDFKSMDVEGFLKLDDKKLNEFLKTNGFREKYRAENIKQMVRSGATRPVDLANYLEDANSRLFDTPVVGAEVYRSNDGGSTWTKMNTNYLDNLFYSYGYYFGEIRVAPQERDKIYIGGVPLIKSDDGGKTYSSISGANVHADHHALWVDPKMPGHLINGNDGGVNISYDDGAHWIKNNSPSAGQFYAINVDNQRPYNIYGGLQDNGVWMGPHTAVENDKWHQTGSYPWKPILGGDGMQIQIDNRNNNIIYTGFQFGNYSRIDLSTGKRKYIQPKHELGEHPYRFNWQTPILLSSHNQDILYLGSNHLHRSLDQGNSWETISPDLTQGNRKGNVAYGTLTTISESPLKFGLIYAGSDDGRIQVTQNGGASWTPIDKNIDVSNDRTSLWISRVVASKHKKQRVYVSLNGYRWDNFKAYIYVSEDYGKTWNNISNTIPASPVNVIIEDPVNENLLFSGTDNGLYVSFDRGTTWEVFQNGMPNVAVHDLVIQPTAKHLLVGTHGRSIYKADISPLQKMTANILGKALHLFEVDNIHYNPSWGHASGAWSKPTTPGLDLTFYSSKASSFLATIKSADGTTVSSSEIQADKGLNVLSYDLAFSKSGKASYLKNNKKELPKAENGKTYLPKGKYTVIISGNGKKTQTDFEIKTP